jgi:type I restriction enzyme S subunit
MTASLQHAASQGDDLPQGYKRTEVGVIPVDWELSEIGALEPFITSGSRGWARFYSEIGSPFIRITNMQRSSIYLSLEDLKLVKLPEGENEGIRTQLKDKDLLISMALD